MSAPDIEIYKTEGASVLAVLHAACFEAPWNEDEIFKLLDSTGVEGLILRQNDDAIGLAMIRVIAGEAELLTIGTIPTERRKGHGLTLLRACEDRAASCGASRLILEVSERNTGALGLYRTRGYHEIGQRKSYYRDGSTAHVLSKPL
jgi:ribosomal-protein-alanine N-acetyltransferase